MTMQSVSIEATAAQSVNVLLDGQACRFQINQKFFGLFIDVYVNDALIIGGVICENLNRIVRSGYLGFLGDLCFLDQEGTSDPVYTGLGTRWILVYLDQSDLASLGLSE